MADAGKLTLSVVWDGHSVRSQAVRSTRPQAASLLKGKSVGQVTQLVPLLFSVCGQAQAAAARAALQAAQQGGNEDLAVQEQRIRYETVQEHLWRMLLDWPKLLGIPTQEACFVKWYAMLRDISAGMADRTSLKSEFERDWLGMSLSDWRKLGDVQVWWRSGHSPAAQLLSELAEQSSGMHGAADSAMLPLWSAAQAQTACAARWGKAFSAAPDVKGVALETGVRSYHPELSVGRYSGVLARVLARLADTVELIGDGARSRLDAYSSTAGEGVAVVHTARGMLMHHVLLENGHVREYEIVAPTEWNFHSAGAFVQEMSGLQETDAARLSHKARLAALSLDPCVPYEVEVQHA